LRSGRLVLRIDFTAPSLFGLLGADAGTGG
jgi:hypothetical protein